MATLTGLAATAHSATFSVTSANDSGPGSLRTTIDLANATPGAPHTITFALPPDSVITTLTTLPSAVAVGLAIDGSNSPGLIIDGNESHRIFDLASAGSLTLRDLSLRNGVTTDLGGGCVRSSHSSTAILVERVHMSDCIAANPAASIRGGALLAHGQLFVYESTFTNNRARSSSAHASGGAIGAVAMTWIEDTVFDGNRVDSDTGEASGGAVSVGARLTVLRSRFLRNRADQPESLSYGGAIHVRNDLLATIRQSLFFDNAGQLGSAIWARPVSTNAIMDIIVSNNTIAGNRGGAAMHLRDTRLDLKNNSFWKNEGSPFVAHLLVHGQLTEIAAASNNLFAATASGEPACQSYDRPADLSGSGANIFTDTTCDFIDDFSIVTGDDLRIRGLRHTGTALHNIPVIDLFDGSPAIDNGNPNDVGSGAIYACTAGDARDEPRPADGNADGEAICDIGALELQHEASLFADDFEIMLLQ